MGSKALEGSSFGSRLALGVRGVGVSGLGQ